MVLFGALGYILKKFKYPLAPLVVGFILSDLLELYLRRSLMRSEGSLLPFAESPISVIFLICTVITICLTIRGEVKKARAKVA